jgi:hypothetical protein
VIGGGTARVPLFELVARDNVKAVAEAGTPVASVLNCIPIRFGLNIRLSVSPPLRRKAEGKRDMDFNNVDSLRPTAAAAYLSDKVGCLVSTRLLEGWRKRRLGPPWFRLCGLVLYPRTGLDGFVAQARRSVTNIAENSQDAAA